MGCFDTPLQYRGRSGTVPVESQTRMVVPIFKKAGQKVRSNYRVITLLSFSGKVYPRVLEKASNCLLNLRFRRSNMD